MIKLSNSSTSIESTQQEPTNDAFSLLFLLPKHTLLTALSSTKKQNPHRLSYTIPHALFLCSLF